MARYKILFCRFPGDHKENPDCTDWFVRAMLQAKADPRVEKVCSWYKADTPITMTRNLAIEVARNHGVDFVVMVDNDMYPDMYVGHNPQAKPFFPLALDFLIKHNGPGMIAVPYCGPPPIENVYVFRWATCQSTHPNPDLKIDQYSRENAAVATGIEEVAALPTGLCMFHLSAVDKLTKPYFYYEWKGGEEGPCCEKASTEDVTFTRDLAFAGVPIYVAWDSWAGHWKKKLVGRPGVISVKDVAAKYVSAIKGHLKEEFAKKGDCEVCGHSVKQYCIPDAKTEREVQETVAKQIAKVEEEASRVIHEGFAKKFASTDLVLDYL